MSAINSLLESLGNKSENATLVDVKFFPGNIRHLSPEQFAIAATNVVTEIHSGKAKAITSVEVDAGLSVFDCNKL